MIMMNGNNRKNEERWRETDTKEIEVSIIKSI
jgi:hypothetical protein